MLLLFKKNINNLITILQVFDFFFNYSITNNITKRSK